eukprot:GFUD01023373.1.p1 GENE.GFUD01023373.1~~GFUD01023373.1.p1  ORF type:complete len:484 (-),score=134.16 GFUD01023373.1:223-1674(-)
MPLNRKVKALKIKIEEDEMKNMKKIAELNIMIEANKKQHNAQIAVLKARHLKDLGECEEKVEAWKKVAANLNNMFEDEKKDMLEDVMKTKHQKVPEACEENGETWKKVAANMNIMLEDEKKDKIDTIIALDIVIEKNNKQHETEIGDLKALKEKELGECEEEVKGWKRQAENLTSILVKEKKEHEDEITILSEKIETSRINEEEIKCLKLKIEEGKAEIDEVKDKQKHFFGQLKEQVECPVCMEIPRGGPVYVCPNGHFVCKKCKTGSCPTCRVGMGTGKSLLAVTVVENIEHSCKFVDCKEFFALDKVDDHEKICQHRTVSCPYDKCSEKLPLSKLLDHLNENVCSFKLKVIENYSKSGSANFKVPDGSESLGITWKQRAFSYQETSFVIFPMKFDNFYYFTMVMLESEKECSKYNIEMEVHAYDPISPDSGVRFKFFGKPCSIDEEKNELKYLGLSVNCRGMEKILRESKDSRFTLSFKFS